ncbi:putative ATP-dependent RNA helicase DHR1 [Coemansia sp. RSA 1365]|nr:putative ATP-dependent RNA helicase DHR1 [Coemansia sp. RSA 1365]
MGTNKSKKQKRFEKFVEKQVKKEERAELLEKLSTSSWKSGLLRSSRNLGRQNETKREKLQRAALEEKLGVLRSDPSVRLYVSKQTPEEIQRQGSNMANISLAMSTQQRYSGTQHKEPKNTMERESLQSADISLDQRHGIGAMEMYPKVASLATGSDQQTEENSAAAAGSGLGKAHKRQLDEVVAGSSLAAETITKRVRQKKGRILEKLGLGKAHEKVDSSESEFDSSASESDDSETRSGDECDKADYTDKGSLESAESCGQTDMTSAAKQAEDNTRAVEKQFYTGSMLKPLLAKRGMLDAGIQESTKAYYVPVERSEQIQRQRMQLPVYAEEQQIMEAITQNLVVVLSGETGSGKTTQVPQFLLEAGYGDNSSRNPGMIGITQPRRVAAVSMAHRVAEELGSHGHTVAHQVRFDTTVSDQTRIKFMTEGVLLRELAADLLLTKYSVIIADEAHERSLNTDILLGVLSRVVRLRQKLARECPDKHRELRLVIMSATLRVDDFAANERLFRTAPPIIRVQARQHPVRIHFSRRTPAYGEYVHEVVRKVSKIHRRLPEGGILVFLTGQAEITYVCKQLRALFSGAIEFEGPAQSQVSALEASVEDEDMDVGDGGPDELRDDFAYETDSASESEEEDTIIVGDVEDGARQLLLAENLHSGAPTATSPDAATLHVLPLYAMLAAEQQLRVFAAVPAGRRLCVVATNVAETSITIPGIRYVVDAGLVKEKAYNTQTLVQRFHVGWTSQAAAMQRAGRAGRTGPGHCYRLFSSAVFNDQFAAFSRPEVLRMPIEGVVLQMKTMGLDNIANFPFPTPPPREALARAELLLRWLGALDVAGHVTELGRLMAVFPVAPRFAKMLIVGQQHGCLAYVIMAVAALSVGDPFVREACCDDAEGAGEAADLINKNNYQDDKGADDGSEEQSTARRRFWQSQARLTGSEPTSDILKWLTVIGAVEYAGGSDAACSEHFVRPKAINEIRKLRQQLTALMQTYCPNAGAKMVQRMAPPSKTQQMVIRQIVLAGFVDQVAVRGDIAGYHASDDEAETRRRGLHAVPYMTMWNSEPVFIHPESVVYATVQSSGSMPQAVVFAELQHSTRMWAKVATVVSSRWLATIGQPLCSFGNPLPFPRPEYNSTRDEMTCHVEPRFGPRSWPLAMVKVRQRRAGTRWQITDVIG